jgi:hypothetical protein
MKLRFSSLAVVVILCACACVERPVPEVKSVNPGDSSQLRDLVSKLTDDLLEERDSALRELCGRGLPAISAIRSALTKNRNAWEAELLNAALEVVVSKYVGSLGYVVFCSGGSVWISRLDGSELKAITGARDSNENAFRPEAFDPDGVLIIDGPDGLYSAAPPSWDLRPLGPRLGDREVVIFDRSARRWKFGDEVLVQDKNPFYGLRRHKEGKWTELERTRTEFTSVAVWDYRIAQDKAGRLLVASACSCHDAPRISVIDPRRLGMTTVLSGKPADGIVFQWNADETRLAVIVGKRLFTWDGTAFKPIFDCRESLRSVSWSVSGRRLALMDWREQLHVVDLEGHLQWRHSFFRPEGRLDVDVAWMDDERFGLFLKRSNPWSKSREEHSVMLMDSKRQSIQVVADDQDLILGKLVVVRGDPGLIYYKMTSRGEWHPTIKSGEAEGRSVGVDLFFYSLEDSKSYRISRSGLLQGGESDDFQTRFLDPRFFFP